MKNLYRFVFALVACCLFACSDNNTVPPQAANESTVSAKLDSELDLLIREAGLTGNPAKGLSIPAVTDPLVELGKALFFSKALSGQGDTACVSCHHPVLGGGDDLSLPVGVDAVAPDQLGPGRLHRAGAAGFDGGPTVPRNAPTTFNIALWNKQIFHDGRIHRLDKASLRSDESDVGIVTPDMPGDTIDPQAHNLAQAQALFPVTSSEEMRGNFGKGLDNQALRSALMNRLVSQQLPNAWLPMFRQVFAGDTPVSDGDLMTYENVSIALGAYERSQLFINNPWRRYIDGDASALSAQAKRGAIRFYTAVADGGAGCVACHSGDTFTDELFHVLAMPQLGRGKGDGEYRDDDFGRGRETGHADDRYAFRTPSLLNVSVTGPWTHAGAYSDLATVIRHHANPQHAVDNYDFYSADLQPGLQGDHAQENTRKALEQWERLRDEGKSLLQPSNLDDIAVNELLAFINALTDPCVEDRDCLAPWIADPASTGFDGLQLNAVDEQGNML